jgi:hypothetical protein
MPNETGKIRNIRIGAEVVLTLDATNDITYARQFGAYHIVKEPCLAGTVWLSSVVYLFSCTKSNLMETYDTRKA